MEITAKGLRSRVGEVLRCVERGETVTVTYRGRPRARLVGIEEESASAAAEDETSWPAFGMWKDRTDMADVAAHVRRLREGRFRAG